jgi:hypothetical protein
MAARHALGAVESSATLDSWIRETTPAGLAAV